MQDRVVVIGAGMGGLATTLRLAAAGVPVRLIEAHPDPGGKLRTVSSAAGPVDAGPTVLTMRHVFDDLFAAAGTRLDEHVTLVREPLLARHFWLDGSQLDLWDDPERSAEAVRAWGGAAAETDFRAFSARAKRLYEGLDAPMMQAPRPTFAGLAAHMLRHPRMIADMGTGTLAAALRSQVREPRLRQLFGRYATYVGGAPDRSPAVLGLIWHAEASGVWRVAGGMHRLAQALATLAERLGAEIDYGTPAAELMVARGRVTGVRTQDGAHIPAGHVVFAGDPRALAQGHLGATGKRALPKQATEPRSLSAHVLAFAATVHGPDLAHHNVFFADAPEAEFGPIARGRLPEDPTVYVCAEDRGGTAAPAPGSPERFETIVNAPATGDRPDRPEEIQACLTRTLTRLAQSGLAFSPAPTTADLTTQRGFEALFPGSAGALYGRSPHGLMAAFARPTARTRIAGLILAGGGAHPGAGVPMATLSGRHAAAAIMQDRTSISMSPKTGTPGGMSTASPTTAHKPSPSSPSSAPSSRPGTAGPAAATPPTTAA